MKKTARCIAMFFALAASGAIVLHAGHLDASHVKGASDHCGLCQTVKNVSTSVVVFKAPTFVVSDVAPLLRVVHIVSVRISHQDPRGPPTV